MAFVDIHSNIFSHFPTHLSSRWLSLLIKITSISFKYVIS